MVASPNTRMQWRPYLALAVSKMSDYNSSLVLWSNGRDQAQHVFSKQTLQMTWDFAEVNPLAGAAGDPAVSARGIAKTLDRLPASGTSIVRQLDATTAVHPSHDALISTDPPYYDNIGYADLSDYFYVWLRRALNNIYPDLFSTLLTPKQEELVATPYRHGGRREAEVFFEEGLFGTFARMRGALDPSYPLTLFYAFKQAELHADGAVASTGWDTMLTALLDAGFTITGTWPMRTERPGRSREIGSAALASSIVLVCRPRPNEAPFATRRELVGALRGELPEALRTLQHGNIAPVDLAQAAIGPGMAVFSRYAKVLEADGSAMTVRTALGLINQALDEILAEQEGDFDADTRFAVTWFEQYGFGRGRRSARRTSSRGRRTPRSTGMVEAQVLVAARRKVRLLRRDELPADWDPASDARRHSWEAAQHLVRRLETGGEGAAAELCARLGGDFGERRQELAYRLYSRSASARAGRRRPSRTTRSSSLGRRSRGRLPARPKPRASRRWRSRSRRWRHEQLSGSQRAMQFARRRARAVRRRAPDAARSATTGPRPSSATGAPRRPNARADAQFLLKAMIRHWREGGFGDTLGHAGRTWVSELLDARNRWAHHEPFSTDQAYRALDTAQLLLNAVGAGEHATRHRPAAAGASARAFRRGGAPGAPAAARRARSRACRPRAFEPWREVVTPHRDVASGRYQQAEFAADLHQVWRGEAADEYGDPSEFFRRTFLTEGLRDLLVNAVRRLRGEGGDPVVELQTNFGGGKTHSLIALYHLAGGYLPAELPGVEQMLAEAGLGAPPRAATAVLVGHELEPATVTRKTDGTEVRTLWGELAWQLGGAEGYALVADADRTGTNPGEALVDLFRAHAPCLS